MPKAKVNSVPDDEWVPDPVVCQEFGITAMTLWRWDHDPELGFPPPFKVRNRKFRRRQQINEWKNSWWRAAIARRTPEVV